MSEKRISKVEGGYAIPNSKIPVHSGTTRTVEVVEYYVGGVELRKGPTLSWDLPAFDPSANADGWFVDEETAEFVLCQQSTDYGNGPGRAVATIVRRVKALRSAE